MLITKKSALSLRKALSNGNTRSAALQKARTFSSSLKSYNPASTTPNQSSSVSVSGVEGVGSSTHVGDISSCPYHQKGETIKKQVKSWDEVPGPKPLPLLGNLMDIKNNSNNTSEYFLSLNEQYGDLVKLTVLGSNMLIVANPFHLADLFRAEDQRQPMRSTRYYKDTRGLELSPVEMRVDENWNAIRQLYNIAMKPSFEENITLPHLSELNGDFLRRIIKHLKTVDESEKYRLLNGVDAISRYGFDAVLKVFLGVKMTDELAATLPFKVGDFVNYSVSAVDLAVRLDNKPALYKFYKTKEYKEFENVWDHSYEYARYCIQRFKQNPSDKERFLELLDARAEGQENSVAKVESVMISFLQAAIDITMRMMTHVYYRLAHHPEYQEKIYNETVEIFGEPTIEEITSENGLNVTKEQYKKLKITKHFLEEVLRLNSFSFLTMGRKLSQDSQIGDYMVPKDTTIIAMQRYATLKDEFIPRGKEFIPERHEKGSPLAPVNNFVSVP